MLALRTGVSPRAVKGLYILEITMVYLSIMVQAGMFFLYLASESKKFKNALRIPPILRVTKNFKMMGLFRRNKNNKKPLMRFSSPLAIR